MTRTISLVCAIGAVLVVSACETTTGPGPAPAPVAFDARAFDWSTAQGSGRITGRLAFTSRGATYSCREAGVVAIPETPWVRQRMRTLYLSNERSVAPAEAVRSRMPANSPNYNAYVRQATCDAEGRFSFSGLPNGAWYVITTGRSSVGVEDMAFMRRVVVRGGGTQSVVF